MPRRSEGLRRKRFGSRVVVSDDGHLLIKTQHARRRISSPPIVGPDSPLYELPSFRIKHHVERRLPPLRNWTLNKVERTWGARGVVNEDRGVAGNDIVRVDVGDGEVVNGSGGGADLDGGDPEAGSGSGEKPLPSA